MAYKDFKSYIQAHYAENICAEISKFVNKHHDAHGFHSFNAFSLCEQGVENIQIKAMHCHDDIGPRITMDIHCTADIVMYSLGSRKTVADRRTKWFTVYAKAVLRQGLHDFSTTWAGEYVPTEFDMEDALDEYLVPYISADQLEDEAEDFYNFYCDKAIYHDGWALPVEYIFMEMGIQYYNAELPQNEFGRVYFREKEETVFEEYPDLTGRSVRVPVKKSIQPGTMLISDRRTFMGDFGTWVNTVAHELVHWDKHQKFFEIIALLNADEVKLSCEVMPEASPQNLVGVKKAYWWAEWQANSLANRICMPRQLFCMLLEQCFDEALQKPHRSTGEAFEDALVRVGQCFGVSDYAAKVRALQLGYKQAEATVVYRDAVFQPCYWFDASALGDHETFRINYAGYRNVYETNPTFRKKMDDGEYVYTGAVVAINDPLYVSKSTDEFNYYGYELTDYALEHAHECCLKFKRTYKTVDNTDDFYSLCYLCKNVDASSFVESKTIEIEDNQDIEEQAKQLRLLQAEGERVISILERLPNSFHLTLDYLISRAKKEDGKKMTNLELEFRTGISERMIRAYRKGEENITPANAYALCIALHLHPILSRDLIHKAHADFPISKEGSFCEYLINNHFNESLLLINQKLDSQGYHLWGNPENLVT